MRRIAASMLSSTLVLVCATLASATTPPRTPSNLTAVPTDPASLTQRDSSGGTFTNQEAGVSFTVPAGWKAEPNGEVIQVSSPDEAVTVVLWVPTEDTFEATIQALGDELDKMLTDVTVEGDAQELEINGIKTYVVTGTGVLDGTPVAWDIAVLAGKKAFIALVLGESASLSKHQPAFRQMMQSFRRV